MNEDRTKRLAILRQQFAKERRTEIATPPTDIEVVDLIDRGFVFTNEAETKKDVRALYTDEFGDIERALDAYIYDKFRKNEPDTELLGFAADFLLCVATMRKNTMS